MSDPNAFTAHHFALLHLLGLLSISRTIEGEKAREARGTSDPYVNLSEGDVPLPIPELLMLNALCYLTEQIHQVRYTTGRTYLIADTLYTGFPAACDSASFSAASIAIGV